MKTIVGLAGLMLATFPSLADSLRLDSEGQPYQPAKTEIVWKVPTNVLPKVLWVYKVIPQNFSGAVVSNAMAAGSLKPSDLAKPRLPVADKNLLYLEHQTNGLPRCLTIAPTLGWINYHDETALDMTRPVEGVPEDKEVERLALDFLFQLGIDRSQIAAKPRPRVQKRRGSISKEGVETEVEVQARGVMLIRQIDGISFHANSTEGGLWIEFCNNAKISQFELVWRNLVPHELRKTAAPEQIVAWIREGKSVMPSPIDLDQAKKLTITTVTPYYYGESAGSAQDFVYPFVSLGVTADIGKKKESFELLCPILPTLPDRGN